MSTIRVAINGFGHIGRNVLRTLHKSEYRNYIQIVAINDLGDSALNTHLTKYDSIHSKFPGEATLDNAKIISNGDVIHTYSERCPTDLPWKDLNIDIVYECTGLFTSRSKASAHLKAGAQKVIILKTADEK